jgi:hypothetical protein
MPSGLPNSGGVYVFAQGDRAMYVGVAGDPMADQLSSQYRRISPAKTLAPLPDGSRGGQQTNCRINAQINSALRRGDEITLWFQLGGDSADRDRFIERFGRPPWNL